MTAPKDKQTGRLSTPLVPLRAPTSAATGFVRYVLGFGVWVALGLAPFLGKARIPGFAPLLELYPHSLQSWLIPLSGFVMGTLALIVEYAAGQRLVLKTARAWFKRGITVLLVSLLTLVVAYGFLVARIPVGDSERYVAVVTGPGLPSPVPEGCDCKASWSKEQCVEEITVNPTLVAACFGPARVHLASLALAFLYLLLTSSFAASAGIVLLLKRDQDAKKRRKRKRSR